MEGKVLVAGLGNIFLGDDAFGVEVVKQLASMMLPDNVVVRDFGIRSYDLAYALMESWDLVILVDAASRDDAPGTIYVIEPDLEKDDAEAGFDAHAMNPTSTLQLVKALGGHRQGKLLVVGCEPQTVEPDESGRMGLSDAVQPSVEEAVRIIVQLLNENGKAIAA